MSTKSTAELTKEILENPDNPALDAAENFVSLTLQTYFKKLLAEKNLTVSEVARIARMEAGYIYKIYSRGKPDKPDRNRILNIAVAMKLTLDETQRLLRYANAGKLYPKNHWDNLLMRAIVKELNLDEINDLLKSFDEPPLWDYQE